MVLNRYRFILNIIHWKETVEIHFKRLLTFRYRIIGLQQYKISSFSALCHQKVMVNKRDTLNTYSWPPLTIKNSIYSAITGPITGDHNTTSDRNKEFSYGNFRDWKFHCVIERVAIVRSLNRGSTVFSLKSGQVPRPDQLCYTNSFTTFLFYFTWHILSQWRLVSFKTNQPIIQITFNTAVAQAPCSKKIFCLKQISSIRIISNYRMNVK